MGETLDYLSRERATAVADLRRDGERAFKATFNSDIEEYLARRASVTDFVMRRRNLEMWRTWFTQHLGEPFKTLHITTELMELGLEHWKQETSVRGGRVTKRWASATLRTRAMHLSNLFTVLYPHRPNPVMAARGRLPPLSPDVDKAQPMPVVLAVLESLRTPTTTRRKAHPSFNSVRVALLGFARITIQELWSIRSANAFDLKAGTLRIPGRRVVERYTTIHGHGRIVVATELREPRLVALSAEALDAAQRYVSYPARYNGGTRLRRYGYIATAGLRAALNQAAKSADLPYPYSPYDFGTERGPSDEEVRAMVRALERDVLPYRPTADRGRRVAAYVRAAVLAHTGARVGELALLEPGDIRLQERVVMMPTEKQRRNAGRLEREVGRRRVPLNAHAIAALKLFIEHDLFDRLADRTRVPAEQGISWYQQFYHQLRWAARRVKDPHTGAALYFTPHCFRHSFATALAPLIDGDVKTGAKILGHSVRTFMKYVRPNEERARVAVDRMMEGVAASETVVGSELRIVRLAGN